MSVNLLSLARSSSQGLHNSSRGGGKSYAPGTTYGNKIAGTNISQGAGLKNLAKKGRTFSGVKDSKIRKVAGRPSHVNTIEAKAIDKLGPLGEAWVQKIGSGTTNPKTGLPEYGWFSDLIGTTGGGGIIGGVVDTWEWLTPSGHTKWFSTENSANFTAQQSELAAKARHKLFEQYRRKYEQENIAGIFTQDDNVDDTSKIVEAGLGSGGYPAFETFIGSSALGTSSNDIQDYTDPYDTRKQDELNADMDRTLDRIGIAKDSAFNQNIKDNAATGANVSSSMFGLLTQATETEAKKNFEGSGDFKMEFQEKQIVDDAERAVLAGKTKREKFHDETKIELDQIMADRSSGVQDLQDQYNQEFWNDMVSWDSAINS